jgi:CBS domain containing-hemolysin-like protein
MSLGLALTLLPLLILLNAFFVVGEYALVAVRPAQVEALRTRGKRRTARALDELLASPASAIGAIQVGITMTNLLLGWIGEPAMSAVLMMAFAPLVELAPAVFTGVAVALSFVVVTLLTVVFSELLPKTMTLRAVERAASLTARPILGFRRALAPLVWLMNGMANLVTVPLGFGRVEATDEQSVDVEELRLLARRAGDQGAVTPRERELILNSLSLGRRIVKEIMVPRVRVAYLDVGWPMDRNRGVMNEQLYSRLPLVDGGLDRVIGYVRTKEFLTAYHAAADSVVLRLIAMPPVFIPETVTIDVALSTFNEKRAQLLFVVDEFGGVEGIVTLRDVVAELLGDRPGGT